MKYISNVLTALFIITLFMAMQPASYAGTVDNAELSPAEKELPLGTSTPSRLVTFTATNDKGFDIKTYHLELTYTEGLDIRYLWSTPTATTAEVNTRKRLIIFEWENIAAGATITAGFTVYTSVAGTYTITPSTVYYTDFNRNTYSSTVNDSIFHFLPDLEAPSAPTEVRSVPGEGYVEITWTASPETDVAGYNVYRSTPNAGPELLSSLGTDLFLQDATVQNGASYYYTVAAVDRYGNNESALSAETAITYIEHPVTSYDSTSAYAKKASVGDINGDGQMDLVVAEYWYDVGSGLNALFDAGKVDIYFGWDGKGNPDITLYGEGKGDEFGRGLVVADLNNDGYDELLVGAPGHDVDYYNDPDSIWFEAGTVYIYAGGPEFNTVATVEIEGKYANGLFIQERLGESMALIGDADNDGYEDIVIGAPYGGTTRNGKVIILYGGSNLSSLRKFEKKGVAYQYLGTSVSAAGDVNNDGYDDIIVGGPGSTYNTYGVAYLYFGNWAALTPAFSSGVENDGFGTTVAGVGDMNGDGYDDIYVGTESSTTAYIYYGAAEMDTTADIALSDDIDFIGSVGDVNKDGIADMLVGPGPQIYYGNSVDERIVDIERDGLTIIGMADGDGDGIKEYITGDTTQVVLNSIGAYASLPSITMTYPTTGDIGTKISHITLTGIVQGDVERLLVHGQEATLSTDNTFSADLTLNIGKNVVEVAAISPDGKVGKQTLTITYSEPDPLTLSITSPPDGSTVNASTITVTGTVSDASATVTVNGVAAGISGTTYTAANVPLQEGANIITATAQDNYGQTATQVFTVTLLTKGTITGTITDSSTGLALAGATVTIIDSAGSQSVTTDTNGLYTASDVTQGSYTATFDLAGYIPQTVSGSLTAGETQAQDV